jgi:hypothetical protein
VGELHKITERWDEFPTLKRTVSGKQDRDLGSGAGIAVCAPVRRQRRLDRRLLGQSRLFDCMEECALCFRKRMRGVLHSRNPHRL